MLSLSLAEVDPRAAVPAASAIVYFIYHEYEPSGLAPTSLLLLVVPGLLASALRAHYTTLLWALVSVCTGYWTLLVLFVVAYRASPFHPLAGYPGPFLCKISKIWHAYLVVRTGKAHRYIQELHEQYGEAVRIGPNELSVSHKDAAAAVLGLKGLPRGPYYNTREHDAGVSLDGLRDMSLHTVRRRPWAKGMNSTAMKHYEGLIRSTVDDLLAALHEREGQRLDISAWMTFFGFDFMGHMAFSYDFRMLKDGRDSSGLAHLIERALTEAAWLSHLPWAIPLAKTLGGSRAWDEIKVVGEATVKRRVEAGIQQPDLFHHLLDEGGPDSSAASLVTAAIDGQLAIIAGSDTAATTLAHCWYFMLTNPGCFRRLRQEIDDAFPHGEDTSSDLALQSTLPFLNACINETLRLYPPVLTGLQRRVADGAGGKMIGPYFVPEQTQVSLWAYSIHRDPRHYSPLPNAFWPDRWLVQDKYALPSGDIIPQAQVRTDREMFMPFSQGPMVCAGKNVALAEMRAVVCAIVRAFDFDVVDKSCFERWEADVREIFVTKRGALPVLLKARTAGPSC